MVFLWEHQLWSYQWNEVLVRDFNGFSNNQLLKRNHKRKFSWSFVIEVKSPWITSKSRSKTTCIDHVLKKKKIEKIKLQIYLFYVNFATSPSLIISLFNFTDLRFILIKFVIFLLLPLSNQNSGLASRNWSRSNDTL